MPGPPPKPNRQRRNRPSRLRLVPGGLVERGLPRAPRGLLQNLRDRWDRFWRSDLAQLTEADTNLGAITRLFTLYDERERAYRGYRKERIVEGHKGQPVLNPLGRLMAAMDTEIRQLEDRFGLNPKARLLMGITLGEAVRSLSTPVRHSWELIREQSPVS